MYSQEILYQNIANCFRSYREFSALTISELATLLKISPEELENIEQETTEPCLLTIFNFSLLFYVSIDHLCLGMPPKSIIAEIKNINELAIKRDLLLRSESEMKLIPIFKNEEIERLLNLFLQNPECDIFEDFDIMLTLFIYHLSFPDINLEVDKVFAIDKMIVQKCIEYRNQRKRRNHINVRILNELFNICKDDLATTRLIYALDEIFKLLES